MAISEKKKITFNLAPPTDSLSKIRFKSANFNNNFHIHRKIQNCIMWLPNLEIITSREYYFRPILVVSQLLSKFAHLNRTLDSCKIAPSQKWMNKLVLLLRPNVHITRHDPLVLSLKLVFPMSQLSMNPYAVNFGRHVSQPWKRTVVKGCRPEDAGAQGRGLPKVLNSNFGPWEYSQLDTINFTLCVFQRFFFLTEGHFQSVFK